MTTTAWKIMTVSLAALLLVTVGVLIGTNLGSSNDDSTQPVTSTTVHSATTTTASTTASTTTSASTTSPTSPTSPVPTTTSVSEAQRLGNRFQWCADLQTNWDELDAEVAKMTPEAVLTAVTNEIVRAAEQGETPTGIAQVLVEGSPRQPTQQRASTAPASVTERAWSAFGDAASSETLASVDALASAAEDHDAAAADYQAIRDAATAHTEDSLVGCPLTFVGVASTTWAVVGGGIGRCPNHCGFVV